MERRSGCRGLALGRPLHGSPLALMVAESNPDLPIEHFAFFSFERILGFRRYFFHVFV